VPAVEAWERVWIDAQIFGDDVHSYINCTECHGGQAVDDYELAHEALKVRTVDSPEVCGDCHVDVGEPAFNSLHNTLVGYDTALYARSAPEHHDDIEIMQANHCNDCHATCGDCHVSQPFSVGGGLLDGHSFVESPSMSRNCTACHGSRIKDEYYGAHEELSADVHFLARMDCMECHQADEMHGMGMTDATDRYDGAPNPACEDCHDDLGMGVRSTEIEEHKWHEEDLMSCQTCHSQQYTNCVNCHVEQSDEGVPFFTVEDHFLDFKIGRNPFRTEERPYEYVPLRHVPIDRDSFSFYGEDLMPNFDDRPTWLPTTPHNIQRITAQAEDCDNCHENVDVWLTLDDIAEDEREANRDVVVEGEPN